MEPKVHRTTEHHESTFKDLKGFGEFVQLHPTICRITKGEIWDLVKEDAQLAVDFMHEFYQSFGPYTRDKLMQSFESLKHMGYKEDRFNMVIIVQITKTAREQFPHIKEPYTREAGDQFGKLGIDEITT